MCHKLLQIYACGHTKEVCTSPCPHALYTAQPSPTSPPSGSADAGRPVSLQAGLSPTGPTNIIPDSPAHAATPKSVIENLPSQRERASPAQQDLHRYLTSANAPPRYSWNGQTNWIQPPHGVRPGPALPQSPATIPLPTSSTSPTVPISSVPQPLPTSPMNEPEAALDEIELIPKFCAYIFQRRLPPSRHPCLQCYLLPEYTRYREYWINDYRTKHSGTKAEDLLRLAGVEQIPERLGLVNAMQEISSWVEEKKE